MADTRLHIFFSDSWTYFYERATSSRCWFLLLTFSLNKKKKKKKKRREKGQGGEIGRGKLIKEVYFLPYFLPFPFAKINRGIFFYFLPTFFYFSCFLNYFSYISAYHLSSTIPPLPLFLPFFPSFLLSLSSLQCYLSLHCYASLPCV